MVARARTTKRRKVGRVKAPARESNRERAGAGRAWWARRSLRQAARALRACRRRRLRSRRRVRRAWLPRAEAGQPWRCPDGRRRDAVAILDIGASLVSMTAGYLHCTKNAPPLRPVLKRGRSRA